MYKNQSEALERNHRHKSGLVSYAMYAVTDHDSFCQRGMDVYYGDDYDQLIDDKMVEAITTMVQQAYLGDFPEWEVREHMLDRCETWHNKGKWYLRDPNDIWREFATDNESEAENVEV